MTRKEAIATLKNRIKQLAVEQKEEKKITRQDHDKVGHDAVWDAFCSIGGRKIEINAHLNIYAEVRGRVYRHYSSHEWAERATRDRENGVRLVFAVTEEASKAEAS